MRKIALILLLFMPHFTMDSNQKADELVELAHVAQDANLEIEEWIMTINEKVNQKRVNQILKKLKKENSNVVTTHSNETKQYVVHEADATHPISITYRLLVPDNKQQLSTFTAEIKGTTQKNFSTKKYRKVNDLVTRTYFSDNANRFACLITKSDDIIKGVVFEEKIKEKLNFTPVFTQTDTVLNSTHNKITYGYIKEWDNKIKLHNHMINVHIVLAGTTSNKQRIIIGTPILINEY